MIRENVMETVRIEFEPFINDEARQFIVKGVDYFNIVQSPQTWPSAPPSKSACFFVAVDIRCGFL